MNFQMKMSYKTEKQMKKLYGKNLGREIAFGRNLVKFLKDKYQPERSKREDLCFCEYCEEDKSKEKIAGFICKQCMQS